MYKVIKTTSDSKDVMNKISKEILNLRLSPCISINENCNTSYIWKNKINKTTEHILSIKTIDSDMLFNCVNIAAQTTKEVEN